MDNQDKQVKPKTKPLTEKELHDHGCAVAVKLSANVIAFYFDEKGKLIIKHWKKEHIKM